MQVQWRLRLLRRTHAHAEQLIGMIHHHNTTQTYTGYTTGSEARGVPGFARVTEDEVTELLEHQEEVTIEEMVDDVDIEMEQCVENNEEEIKKGISTSVLSRAITECSKVHEMVEDSCYETKKEWEDLLPLLKKVTVGLSDMYYQKINKKEQTRMTRFFKRKLRISEAMAGDGDRQPVNIDVDDVDKLLNDYNFIGFGEGEVVETGVRGERSEDGHDTQQVGTVYFFTYVSND